MLKRPMSPLMSTNPSIELGEGLLSGQSLLVVNLSTDKNANAYKSPSHRSPRGHPRWELAHFAVLALLLSFVVIGSLCRISSSKGKSGGGLVTRRLAVGGSNESEDEESPLDEQACQTIEEAIAALSGESSQDTPASSLPPSANVTEEEKPRKRKRKTNRPADSDGDEEEPAKLPRVHSPVSSPDSTYDEGVASGLDWQWELTEDDVIAGMLLEQEGLAPWLVDPSAVPDLLYPLPTTSAGPSTRMDETKAPIGKDDSVTSLYEAAKSLQSPQRSPSSSSSSDYGALEPPLPQLSPVPTSPLQRQSSLEPPKLLLYDVRHSLSI